MSSDSNFKIGIVWSGNPHNRKDPVRSCSLDDFALLSEVPGVSFFSLQKGTASAGAINPPGVMEITNLEDELNDFAETAAAIVHLDLVISVDTAVVHLAGAMNKPVWLLLQFAPDWRWLLKRDDSPWYPSMRLFRQTKPNDWKTVFEEVKDALIQEVERSFQIC